MKKKKSPTSNDNLELALVNSESEDLVEPSEWTIVSAMNRVLLLAHKSQLSPEFWEKCKNPMSYLTQALGLSDIQVVVLAVLIEAGASLSWRKLGNFLGCSRLTMMTYSEDIEGLVDMRWAYNKGCHEDNGQIYEGFALEHGVVTAIRHNTKFVPEKIDGLTTQGLVDKLEARFERMPRNIRIDFDSEERWMVQLLDANRELPLCKEVLALNDVHEQSLMMLIINDYARYADTDIEGLYLSTIDDYYPSDYVCNHMRRKLKSGNHTLFKKGWIEFYCNNGVVDVQRYKLTDYAKNELLADYAPFKSEIVNNTDRQVISHTTITEKELFYNASEQQQIDSLTDMLSQEHLKEVQKRLEQEGMRKGVACLFHGGPGTGKTETVLQIARQTGRDIMQIEIAGLRDKWVGESEKNIKAVFSRYRKLCRNSEVMPILFFNEADGVFGKRFENIEGSVDKMDNAMQNIILQEMETLEGVLIATTNLTANLDSAFERRFLFKIEFNKPEVEVKAKIWHSMLKDISFDDAMVLASQFDFSGGQIENVVRKRTIGRILTGTNASLDELVEYCNAERLNSQSEMKRIGFAK